MYDYIEPGIEDLAASFCNEAEHLLAIERSAGRDSITSIAAIELICLGYLGQGKDHAILAYVSEASDMGVRMGLFGIEEGNGDANADGDVDTSHPINVKQRTRMHRIPNEAERAQMFAAWGVFNWIT